MNSEVETNSIDYGDFAARLEARKDRWSLLKEILDEWDVVVQVEEQAEFTRESITKAERRLGFTLPTALKEWYALPFRFHRSWPLGGTYLVPPSSQFEGSQLSVRDGFVSFHHEGQSCCQWGFRASDTTLHDPPVFNGMDLVFDRHDFSNVNLTWVLQNQTLSEWVLHRTLLDAIGEGRSYAVVFEATPEETAELLRGFRRMGFPAQPWFQAELFGGLNAIITTWPVQDQLAWERVESSGPHPTLLTRDTWDYYWKPAITGPLRLELCCRNESTLEQFVSRPGTKWELREPQTFLPVEFTEARGNPWEDPFTDVGDS